ncbi:VanZ family protein [Paenibacillaceae bacterium WGS1546]|uniref:VanZ family protein n=1 Tax=Cohnella sp. WGS1546 TaxID=3366810 RepID=UPI00372D42A2
MDYFIDFFFLTIVYFLFFYRKWRKKSKRELVIHTLMYVYVAMVLFVTLMPFTIPFGGTNQLFMKTANLIPFRDLMLSHKGAIRELLLNIGMMTPFGILYPIVSRKGVLTTVALTFFFSLIIEFSQLLSSWWGGLHARTFDVTDLITNTLGGLIGYLIFIVIKPVVKKLNFRCDQA